MGEPAIRRLAVLGLGLLGGSVAGAARERGAAARVVGYARRDATLERAQAAGLVEEVTRDPARAVAGADLVVLATPVSAMPGLTRELSGALSPGAILTDVGSVKGVLAETLPGLLPPGVSYVGSHPMAGSHCQGVEHADPRLFEEAICVVTALPGSPPEPIERVASLWRLLGSRVVRRDPTDHDREVAWISHVPHAVAFAYARAFRDAPVEAAELAGSGFRDFTRIARSDPELWTDILVANGKALSGPLGQTARRLAELARSLEAGDEDAVVSILREARLALEPGED